MVYYNWYDHGILRETGEAEAVENAIETHDFNAFFSIRDRYPNTEDYCFFPAYAWEGNEKVDITTPEGFARITHSEYECG